MLLTGVIVAGFGALMTVAIGAPLAARLATAHAWRSPHKADAFRESTRNHPRFFEPLDFGDDDMLWPSESGRQIKLLPVPGWPSESWDDPDFGLGKGERAAGIAARTAKHHDNDERNKRAHPVKKPSPQRNKRAHPVKKPSPQQNRAHQQRSVKQRVRPPSRPAPPPPVAPADASGLPSKAELELMIQSQGLAGTVQTLMRENAWDFKTAAAWLARARKR